MSLQEDMNCASRDLLCGFHNYFVEHGMEPNHMIVVIDWGVFTTQTHTIWSSFNQLVTMMNQAAWQIKQCEEGKTDTMTLTASESLEKP